MTIAESKELLIHFGCTEVTSDTQKKNGTEIWELPLKNKWGYKPKFGIYKSGYVRVLISHNNANAYQINPCIKSFFGWLDKYLKVHRRKCKQRVLIDYRHLRYEYLVTYILKNYGKYLQRQN